jgi:hypothetical protein
MRPPADLPRTLSDHLVRDALRSAANLRDFLRAAVPKLADGFDYTRVQEAPREFLTEHWRSREVDLLFEIPYRTARRERTAWVVVLIEHQSDTDPVVPLRTLFFVVGHWVKQWQEWDAAGPGRGPLRLRPILPIVLYTSDRPWGSNRRLADLLDEELEDFHPFAPDWEPVFWNLAEKTVEGLLAGGPWMQFLSLMRAANEDIAEFQQLVRTVTERLGALHASDEQRWYDLMRMVMAYVLWKRRPAEHIGLRQAIEEGSPGHETEVSGMAQTIAEELIEQGWNKGLTQGRTEGALNAYRDSLRRLLTLRFGSVPEDVLRRIDTSTEVDRLTAAIERVFQMASPDDVGL